MKWSEVRKIIEKRGWYLWREGTKHDIYRHPDFKEPLLVERHQSQEVRKGLLNKIRKQVGF